MKSLFSTVQVLFLFKVYQVILVKFNTSIWDVFSTEFTRIVFNDNLLKVCYAHAKGPIIVTIIMLTLFQDLIKKMVNLVVASFMLEGTTLLALDEVNFGKDCGY